MYILNAGSIQRTAAILRFSGASGVNGNATPSATITGSNTKLGCPHFGFLDVPNDRLYVGDFCANAVLVFDNISTLNGNVAPSRALQGNLTTFDGSHSVAVDTARDILYVSNAGNSAAVPSYGANPDAILVFNNASSVNGNVAPNRMIKGALTNLTFPHGVMIDSVNDRLYVANLGRGGHGYAVLAFDHASSSTQTGNIAPTRNLSGAATQLTEPIFVQIDNANNLIVDTRTGNSINVFANADTVNGNTAPTRVISGANTTLDNAHQISYNSNVDELYLADPFSASVLMFPNFSAAAGNLAPARIVTGSNTGFAILPGATILRTDAGVLLDFTR
jgi:hypothetical protein